MKTRRNLTVFKFVDGLTFYGYIKKTSKDGWLADIIKCDGINVDGQMNACFVEKGAVDVHFTAIKGEKTNG